MDVTVNKVFLNENAGSKVGTASITIDGSIGVRDIHIMDGENGLWLRFPSRPKKNQNGDEIIGEDGHKERIDLIFPVTKEVRKQITDLVLEEYNKVKEHEEQK